MAVAMVGLLFACQPPSEPGTRPPGPPSEAALVTAVPADLPPEHYVAQAELYFDTYDVSVQEPGPPDYAERVIRWEWPPWLYLTGYEREFIVAADPLAVAAMPSTVTDRDCRFFDQQPFARCRVTFSYAEGTCPIYEEFAFDRAGRVVFVEAWSDLPGFLPMDGDDDPWGEGEAVARLATRVPGLGSATGLYDAWSTDTEAREQEDPDLAAMGDRVRRFPQSWLEDFAAYHEDSFPTGCDWTE